jgi:hypothetical protein
MNLLRQSGRVESFSSNIASHSTSLISMNGVDLPPPVPTMPGQIALTLMPYGPTSRKECLFMLPSGTTHHAASQVRQDHQYGLRCRTLADPGGRPALRGVQGWRHRIYAQPRAESAAVPLRRLGTPDDIAGGAIFLASHLSDYMTGAMLDMNGGILMV